MDRDAKAREIVEWRTHRPAYLCDDEEWASATAEADAILALERERGKVERRTPLFTGACGHPPDPVAEHVEAGWACHCGWLLDPDDAHAHDEPSAPGPIVHCGKCGCHVAIPPPSETAA
jgi:hypothetical protein